MNYNTRVCFSDSSYNKTFFLAVSSVSWTSASVACSNENGTFARFDSRAELTQAFETLTQWNVQKAWIAMRKDARIELCQLVKRNFPNYLKWTVGKSAVSQFPFSSVSARYCYNLCFTLWNRQLTDYACNVHAYIMCEKSKSVTLNMLRHCSSLLRTCMASWQGLESSNEQVGGNSTKLV